MQSPQMILLMKLLIRAYYRTELGFQGILPVFGSKGVGTIFFNGVCTGN